MTIRYISVSSSRTFPLWRKTVAVIGTLVVGAVALMFSAVVLAVVAVAVLIGGGYLWWRTREARRQFRMQMEQMQRFASDRQDSEGKPFYGEAYTGEIIEGEATRVDAPPDSRIS
jgi:hypothetical protein